MNYVNSPQHATKTTTRLTAPTTRVLSRRLADDPYGRTLGVITVAALIAGAFLAGQQQQQPVVVIERATASLPRNLAPTAAPRPTALPPTVEPPPPPPPTAGVVVIYQEVPVPVYVEVAPAPEPAIDHTGQRPSDESREPAVIGEVTDWNGNTTEIAP